MLPVSRVRGGIPCQSLMSLCGKHYLQWVTFQGMAFSYCNYVCKLPTGKPWEFLSAGLLALTSPKLKDTFDYIRFLFFFFPAICQVVVAAGGFSWQICIYKKNLVFTPCNSISSRTKQFFFMNISAASWYIDCFTGKGSRRSSSKDPWFLLATQEHFTNW